MTNTTMTCDDENLSTYGDKCAGGSCGGTAVTRPANTACTTYAPNGTATRTVTHTTSACNDGDASTYNDKCSGGTCGGTPVSCPSDTTCKTWAPNGTATCTATNVSGGCDDQNAATYNDTCSAGSCAAERAVTCPADTACTSYTPNGTATCTATNSTAACNDGNPATSSDTCFQGLCVGTPVTCPADTACVCPCPERHRDPHRHPHHRGLRRRQSRHLRRPAARPATCGGTPVTRPTDTLCATYAPNGTATCAVTYTSNACDDGNACTQTDVCSQGVHRLRAEDPPALDQRHAAGACDGATGLCSNSGQGGRRGLRRRRRLHHRRQLPGRRLRGRDAGRVRAHRRLPPGRRATSTRAVLDLREGRRRAV
ncbi:MAG: hypothetical protein U1F43_16165 [Myxococcota bacterium]